MRSNLLSYKVVKSSTLENLKLIIEQKETEIKSATDFIKEIEKGNLDSVYAQNDSTQANDLAVSLLSMREQMKKVAEDEKERKWTSEGLAKFVEILRSNITNKQSLADDIISNLVKYLGANQGGLFIVNEDDEVNPFLELTACYAYDRKKFIEKKIAIGQGLIGQAYLEKDSIYMTAVPDNYVQITSGLGNALPKNILIVPLKLNDQVYGIVELASFHLIKKYQIEFVEKLGESIASTISSVRINAKTRKLLEESQQQAESMRSQEEEMRQNMEELSATQEEMQRIVRQSQEKELYLNELINSINDAILSVDQNYQMVSWNKALERNYNLVVERGMDIVRLYPEEGKAKAKATFGRSLAGESFETTESYSIDGNELYILASYSPLKNTSGEIVGALLISKNVTPTIAAQKKAERLVVETQQQAEEMKAQEEELRQNMEELSATQEEIQRVLLEAQEKEAYLREVINAMPDVIYTVDSNYTIVTWNEVLEKSYNLKVEKGFNVLHFYQEEQRAAIKSKYDRALAGESFHENESYEMGEGHELHITASYSPLRNNTNQVIGVLFISRNITPSVAAHKKTEKLLLQVQSKEDILNNLINITDDSIVALDRAYKIICCNQILKNTYLQYNIQIEVGFDMMLLIAEQEKALYKSYFDRALAGESFEVSNHFKNGEIDSYVTLNYSPLKDSTGQIVGIAILSKTITQAIVDQKQTEKQLLEAQQKSEDLKSQEKQMQQYLQDLAAAQKELAKKDREIQEIKRIEKEKIENQFNIQLKKSGEREAQLLKKISHLEMEIKKLRR
jgi:PAS domain S-box-containing protein